MIYITADGDRWDSIAYKLYKDPYAYNALLLFNPQHRKTLVFKAGVRLVVPEIEYEEDIEVAPPWQTD